jgi:hypothetical protein
MPKIGDLSQNKIYKIQSMNNPELVYYGHTCQTLAQRFGHHKSNHNKSSSKQIIDKGDAIILLVEDYPCLNINEARAREGFYILNNPCVNKQVAGRTQQQYYVDNRNKISDDMKQYYVDNKAKIDEKIKKYDEDNKEQRKEYFKQYRANKKAQLININNNNNGIQEID